MTAVTSIKQKATERKSDMLHRTKPPATSHFWWLYWKWDSYFFKRGTFIRAILHQFSLVPVKISFSFFFFFFLLYHKYSDIKTSSMKATVCWRSVWASSPNWRSFLLFSTLRHYVVFLIAQTAFCTTSCGTRIKWEAGYLQHHCHISPQTDKIWKGFKLPIRALQQLMHNRSQNLSTFFWTEWRKHGM